MAWKLRGGGIPTSREVRINIVTNVILIVLIGIGITRFAFGYFFG